MGWTPCACMGEPDAEECTVCCSVLGAESAAEHLPCGHVFCSTCLREWEANQHSDCPQCRSVYRRSKAVRALKPWQGGLRTKDKSKQVADAEEVLEEMRAARVAMEQRAAAAERALRHCRAAKCRATQEAQAVTVTADAAARSNASGCAGPDLAPRLHPAAASAATTDTASGAALRSETALGAVSSRSAPGAATLTEEQRQRAAANRAAALERKRVRDAQQSVVKLEAPT